MILTSDGKIWEAFQHVTWGGSGLVLIGGHNIYYQPDKSSPVVHQVTKTGSEQLTNGITQGMYRGKTLSRKIEQALPLVVPLFLQALVCYFQLHHGA